MESWVGTNGVGWERSKGLPFFLKLKKNNNIIKLNGKEIRKEHYRHFRFGMDYIRNKNVYQG